MRMRLILFFMIRTYAEPPSLGARSFASDADAGLHRYLVGANGHSPLQKVYDLIFCVSPECYKINNFKDMYVLWPLILLTMKSKENLYN